MAFLQSVAFAAFFLEDQNFLAFSLFNDPGRHLGAFNSRLPNFDGIAFSYQQNIIQLQGIAYFTGKLFNPKTLTRCHLILFTAGTNNSVHFFLQHQNEK